MTVTNIGTGKTIEEATVNAKAGLKLPANAKEELIHIEVVAMPKKKVLGLFGGSDAQVKATYDDGKPERKPKPQKKQQPKKNDKPAPKKQSAPQQEKKNTQAKKPAAPTEDKTEKSDKEKITEGDVNLDALCEYVKTIVDALKVEDAKISAKVVDGVIEMNIECDDYGIIIGRRGETLDAIQYLASLTVKNDTNKYARVAINIGDYRAKREASLRALAAKHSAYVLRTGRRHTFEPMNPYERRILHTAVQEIDGVVSRSIGNGIDRRVVIEPEGGVRQSSRGRGGSNRSGASQVKKATPAQKPAGIKYGKIEVNKD